jgi:hypothetical protein
MIMSILGHTTLAEAERYTEDADQERLAEDAVVKLEGHSRFRRFGKIGKNKSKINVRGAGLALPRGVSLMIYFKHLAKKWDSFRSMMFQGFLEQCPTYSSRNGARLPSMAKTPGDFRFQGAIRALCWRRAHRVPDAVHEGRRHQTLAVGDGMTRSA